VKNDDETYSSEGLQIVHNFGASEKRGIPKCIYDGNHIYRTRKATQSDLPLTEFVGPDGLMMLLAFIAGGDFKDQGEVIEMIKRIFIPGYEQARSALDRAVSEGVFEPNTPDGFPHQYQIKLVLDWQKKSEG
jgi:hypothetical protein